MMNLKDKMPVTKILLFFSCLVFACGLGIFAGSSWMSFKFKDTGHLVYGLFVLAGSLFLSAIIRMFADIGQMLFDLRADNQRFSKQAGQLEQKLNNELKEHLKAHSESINRNLQLQVNAITQSLQLQISVLGQDRQSIVE
ncbi:MAG: hypothetical protein PHW98_02685, partial [Candidatus Omnitrophica bacterium]|nr:hypothetical protein [Candidatus Omnitrophota bacterium]